MVLLGLAAARFLSVGGRSGMCKLVLLKLGMNGYVLVPYYSAADTYITRVDCGCVHAAVFPVGLLGVCLCFGGCSNPAPWAGCSHVSRSCLIG
jgi:hypothetical protein